MLLGTKAHTAGNSIRYRVWYDAWLDEGVSLSTATVVLDPAFTATVTDIVIGATEVHSDHFYFTLQGGSVNETFTLDVQITDTRGEVKNDTANFVIQAP